MRAPLALAAILALGGLAPAVAETYPEFEGQWRSTVAGDAWDPGKPAGLAQEATPSHG